MNYEISQLQNALCEKIKSLLSAQTPSDLSSLSVHDWFAKLGEQDLLSQEEGLGVFLAQKELAKTAAWLVMATQMHRLVTRLIRKFGSQTMQETLLASLEKGEQVATIAFSEPARPTSAQGIKTKATKTHNGLYELNGEKDHVIMADVADWFAILANDEEGLAMFVVKRGALVVEDAQPSLGYTQLKMCHLRLNDTQIESAMRIGAQEGLDLVEEMRGAEDRMATANAIGISDRCLEEAKAYAAQPREGGKPAAGYQAVRFKLAEMLTQLQTADLLACRAAVAQEKNDREAQTLWLCAKVFATETACKISDDALRIFASEGYAANHVVAQALLDSRFGPITGHCTNAAGMNIADYLLNKFGN